MCSEDFLCLFLTFRPGVGALWPIGTPVIGTPVHLPSFMHRSGATRATLSDGKKRSGPHTTPDVFSTWLLWKMFADL